MDQNNFELKNGYIFVIAEAAGGVYSRLQLKLIYDLTENISPFLKVTEDQRIGFLLPKEKEEEIQTQFKKAGILLKHYRSFGEISPKSCLGELCPLSEQDALEDSIALAPILSKNYKSSLANVSIGFNGCSNGCTRSGTDDIHIVGNRKGYNLFIGGSSTQNTSLAQLVAENISRKRVGDAICSVLTLYSEQKQEHETLNSLVDRIGIDTFSETLKNIELESDSENQFEAVTDSDELFESEQNEASSDELIVDAEFKHTDKKYNHNEDELLSEDNSKLEESFGNKSDEIDFEDELVADSNELKSDEEELVTDSNELKSDEEELVTDSNELKSDEEELVTDSNDLKSDEEELVADSNDLKFDEEELVADSDDLKFDEEELVTDSDDLKFDEEELVTKSDELKSDEEELATDSDDLDFNEEDLVIKHDNSKTEKTPENKLKLHSIKNEEEIKFDASSEKDINFDTTEEEEEEEEINIDSTDDEDINFDSTDKSKINSEPSTQKENFASEDSSNLANYESSWDSEPEALERSSGIDSETNNVAYFTPKNSVKNKKTSLKIQGDNLTFCLENGSEFHVAFKKIKNGKIIEMQIEDEIITLENNGGNLSIQNGDFDMTICLSNMEKNESEENNISQIA